MLQVAHYLTLLLTTVSVFIAAWTILGPIAAPGGTVFALLVLIVLALLGGQLIKMFGVLLTKVFRVNISMPPLLGTPVRIFSNVVQFLLLINHSLFICIFNPSFSLDDKLIPTNPFQFL